MIIGESEGLTQYLQRLKHYPIFSKEQELTATPEQLVLANLRLVVYLAKRWARTAEELLERIQDGNIGLLIASQKFDPRNGARFSTYAGWYITDAIRQAVLNTTRTVRTPRYVLAHYKRVMDLVDEGFSAFQIGELLGLDQTAVSSIIDYRLASSDEFPELIDGEYQIDVDLIHVEVKMKQALNTKELYVIETRLAGYSQEEIGEHLGISTSRVQQIESLATHKLRSGYKR